MTRELTQKELVTVALYLLGGENKPADTEDIAIKAAEIAPGKFSWKKHREYIDQELVRRALTDAKLNLGFVIGSQKGEWLLTPKGIAFAQNSRQNKWKKPTEREPAREQKQINREKERLLTTDAYITYHTEGIGAAVKLPPTVIDNFFRLNDYVKGEARIQKITRLENQFINDDDLGELVEALAKIEKDR